MSGISTNNTANTAAANLRYPKRQRSAVSYAETNNLSDGNIAEVNDTSQNSGSPTKKKAKKSFSIAADSDSSDGEYELKAPKRKPNKPKFPVKVAAGGIFPFLNLPPEIRNRIYHWCLTIDGGKTMTLEDDLQNYPGRVNIERTKRETLAFRANKPYQRVTDGYRNPNPQGITADGKRVDRYISTPLLIPKVLRINKQIYAEAINMLYSRTFIFRSAKAVMTFVLAIGARNCELIKRIHLDFDIANNERHEMNIMLQMLVSCTIFARTQVSGELAEQDDGKDWGPEGTRRRVRH
ncbi:hypothetical protein BT63DRAFT_450506 [Microthyrium microscopicum]|uniref:DUF7730 domain-containing protein n=1 Tax=Microthyrium microscopicum TaxID=703497 RepID=A0A6A6UWS3_9PEZI|nr:hypothetical protein BT63DRAFT_450506 [Microthyrium microscopicum]